MGALAPAWLLAAAVKNTAFPASRKRLKISRPGSGDGDVPRCKIEKNQKKVKKILTPSKKVCII